MQEQMNSNEAAPAPMAPMAPDAAEQEGTPLDGIISTVDSFMTDPKAITPETLGQLKMDLEDLKTVMDGEEAQEPPTPPAPPAGPAAAGGLAAMIGGK